MYFNNNIITLIGCQDGVLLNSNIHCKASYSRLIERFTRIMFLSNHFLLDLSQKSIEVNNRTIYFSEQYQ